jgi:uncharacterized membrane protein required for colicin V production
MTLLDWILVVVLVGIALSGFWKGAVRIVFGVGGVILGLWLASVASADIAARLVLYVGIDWIASVLAWVIPVLTVVGLCVLSGWGVEKTIEAMHLKWLNRLLGAGIAGVAGLVIMLFLIATGVRLSPGFADLCSQSLLLPRLLEMLGSL